MANADPLGLEPPAPALRAERVSAEDPFDDESVHSSLSTAAISGIRWVGVARVAAEIASFGAIVATARLIPPAEFGRASIALIVGFLAQGMGTAGIGTPIVQRAELKRRDVRSALTLSLVLGLALTALAVGLALTVVRDVFDRRTALFILIISPCFLAGPITGVTSGVLQRRLDFRTLGIVEAGAAVGGTVVTIGLALAGVDGEAIVIGALFTALATLLGTAVVAKTWRFGWDRRSAVELARVGAPATAIGLLDFGTRNVDFALVGAKLGPAALGYYSRAFRLGAEYQAKVSVIMLRLSLPLLARAEGVEELRRIRGRMVRAHALVLFPFIFLLIALAPVLVPFLFGDIWEPAVVPTQILAGSGLAATVMTGTASLLIALEKLRPLLAWTVLTLVLYAIAIAIAAPHGIVAVAAWGTAVQLALMAAAQFLLIERQAGIPARDTFLVDLPAPTIASVVLLAFAMPAVELLQHDLPAIVLLGGVTIVGFILYLGTLRLVFRSAFGEIVEFGNRLGLSRIRRTKQASA